MKSFEQKESGSLDPEISPEELHLGEQVLAFTKRIAELIKNLAVIDMRNLSSEEKRKLWDELNMIDKIGTIILSGSVVLGIEAGGEGVLHKIHHLYLEGDVSLLSLSFIEHTLGALSLVAIALCVKKVQQKFNFKYNNSTKKLFPSNEED